MDRELPATSLISVEPSEGLDSGPRLIVVEESAASDAAGRYLAGSRDRPHGQTDANHRSEERCHRLPAGAPGVLILRVGTLNSPDEARLVRAVRDGATIELEVEVRRFQGILGANLLRVVLLQMALGCLPPARYRISATLENLSYTAWGHPEQARTDDRDLLEHSVDVTPSVSM